MSRRSIKRIILAVVAGYAANGILVAVSEQLLLLHTQSSAATNQPSYFVVDLITQCLYTVVAGYLCCAIAGPVQRAAMTGLMALGVFVGAVSLVTSWKTEPQWYGIALLAVYPPCVWIGWTLKSRVNGHPSSRA